jgi:hypothetical protein
MEILKKKLPIAEAKGWYLLQNECRQFTEDLVDEETEEVTSIERSEVVIAKGAKLTALDIETLIANGITEVYVSNIAILGEKIEYMHLWETNVSVSDKHGVRKRTYVVTADSLTAAEHFISEYLELNVECRFDIIKVVKLEYNKVIKLYDTEREEYEQDYKKSPRWYKSQIFAMIDDGTDNSGNSSTKNILVQATDFESAIKAIKLVTGRNEYDNIYNAFKSMQELNIKDVFVPDENVEYYSNEEL